MSAKQIEIECPAHGKIKRRERYPCCVLAQLEAWVGKDAVEDQVGDLARIEDDLAAALYVWSEATGRGLVAPEDLAFLLALVDKLETADVVYPQELTL